MVEGRRSGNRGGRSRVVMPSISIETPKLAPDYYAPRDGSKLLELFSNTNNAERLRDIITGIITPRDSEKK